MEQTNRKGNIAITLHSGEEGDHLQIVMDDAPNAVVHLSLQQARSLATALIQHVHRADVSNNLKKGKQTPMQAALERTGATLFNTPNSQQA